MCAAKYGAAHRAAQLLALALVVSPIMAAPGARDAPKKRSEVGAPFIPSSHESIIRRVDAAPAAGRGGRGATGMSTNDPKTGVAASFAAENGDRLSSQLQRGAAGGHAVALDTSGDDTEVSLVGARDDHTRNFDVSAEIQAFHEPIIRRVESGSAAAMQRSMARRSTGNQREVAHADGARGAVAPESRDKSGPDEEKGATDEEEEVFDDSETQVASDGNSSDGNATNSSNTTKSDSEEKKAGKGKTIMMAAVAIGILVPVIFVAWKKKTTGSFPWQGGDKKAATDTQGAHNSMAYQYDNSFGEPSFGEPSFGEPPPGQSF